MKTVLVTGFGSFPGVASNPTEAVARAVDGQVGPGFRVVGRVLPVAWARGPEAAIAAAREVDAALVVGLGVAMFRERVEVERVAWCVTDGAPDVDGCCEPGLVGPERVEATLDCARLAAALDAGLSDDPGRYVCNAWLYRVSAALDVPVGFVHVPAAGIEVDRLLRGIRALIGRDPVTLAD